MAKMKYWNGKEWEVLDAKNADTLNGKQAKDFANSIHQHDDRYYTKNDSDGKFASKTEVNNLNNSLKNKADKSQIPVKLSQLQNDKSFVTKDDLNKAKYGDMAKNIYDKNGNGKVDNAENADTVNGKHASDFQEKIIKDENGNTRYKMIVKNGRPYLQVVSV